MGLCPSGPSAVHTCPPRYRQKLTFHRCRHTFGFRLQSSDFVRPCHARLFGVVITGCNLAGQTETVLNDVRPRATQFSMGNAHRHIVGPGEVRRSTGDPPMKRHRHSQVLGVAWEGPTSLRVHRNIVNILYFSLTVPETWDTALCGRGCRLGFFD